MIRWFIDTIIGGLVALLVNIGLLLIILCFISPLAVFIYFCWWLIEKMV